MVVVQLEMERNCTAGKRRTEMEMDRSRFFIATITKSIIRRGGDEHSRRSHDLEGCANHRRLPKIQSRCFYYWRKLSRESGSWNKWLDLLSNSLYFIPSASCCKLRLFPHAENGKSYKEKKGPVLGFLDWLFSLSINLKIFSQWTNLSVKCQKK